MDPGPASLCRRRRRDGGGTPSWEFLFSARLLGWDGQEIHPRHSLSSHIHAALVSAVAVVQHQWGSVL